MPTTESLLTKRANLHAQLEQHIGQINRINGAIALIDELVAEQNSAQPEVLPVVAEAAEVEAA